jgi:superfamily II DNA or RNA helicase
LSLRLPLRQSYRSDETDIATEFMVPCLSEATTYDRATGYFTSGVLQRLMVGLEIFVRTRGHIRLVASPHLTPEDVEQIDKGYRDRDAVSAQRLRDALETLRTNDGTAYARLSWLIANDVLDIRLAFPRRAGRGVYHEKFGIFGDGVTFVAFTGSLNETLAALDNNFEYIDVFTTETDPGRVNEKRSYFERLWDGKTALLDILEFPDALRSDLIRNAPSDYPDDASDDGLSRSVVRELANHQERALAAWRENNLRGLLEMATGTGKTFTALTAVGQLLTSGEIRTAVMLAPQIAIADQWRVEADLVLGIDPIVCHSQSEDWRSRLRTRLALSRFDPKPLVVVALYDTAGGEDFRSQVERFPGPILVVADEVHNVTIDDADFVLQERYDYRLALSATPDRYLDDLGTQKVRSYFDKIVFRYPLSEAISNKVLTPYDYYPVICGPDDIHGPSSLDGVHAAKFHKFVETYPETSAARDGFTLVYCQWQQLAVVKEWLGVRLRKPIHTFTAQEDLNQRREILAEFGSGRLDVLVAMRCLDEGVDVPPTRSAFLLASSENPKQFVQRRGRVLRQYPGKTAAAIYDFIFLSRPDNTRREIELRKELTRFAEFAMAARNNESAFEVVIQAAESLGIPLRQYITQAV